jgi:Protein of unknown function (DUF1822)
MYSALIEATDWTLPVSSQQQAASWERSRVLQTAWGQWNGYLNQLCLDTVLTWLRSEYLPTAKVGMTPGLWGFVNGSIVTVDHVRIALIPTEAIDRSELTVPQEWVDIPGLAADYYVGVQVAPNCDSAACSLTIYGYTTHQQLKNRGSYDAQERTYSLDVDDLIPDLNALWLSAARYTSSQTRSALAAIPTLAVDRVSQLITRLANPALIMPRLEVPFQTWAAILENPQSQQRLCQQRQNGNVTPKLTQLNRWLQGQIEDAWQSLDRVLLPQQLATAVRSNASQATVEIAPDEVYQAQVFDVDGGQIALVMGIAPMVDTQSRISLQVHPAGGAAYLPDITQLRLLAADGSEIGKVNAAVTETIQLQFRVSEGEQFAIEIACGGSVLMERFAA